MRVCSWNVNGLRAIWKKDFREWFLQSVADFVCLQEVKILKEQANDGKLNFDFLGYQSHWHQGKNKGYAGVLTYAKSEFPIVSSGFGFEGAIEEFRDDGRIVELEFGKWVLLNLYFPNGHPRKGQEILSKKMEFYKLFCQLLVKWRSVGKSVIAVGDYNVARTEYDLARPQDNVDSIGFLPEERASLTQVLEFGYLDVFRHMFPEKQGIYSWWSYKTRARERNVGWRIDYVIVSDDLKGAVLDVKYENDVMGSDHCPVTVDFDDAFFRR